MAQEGEFPEFGVEQKQYFSLNSMKYSYIKGFQQVSGQEKGKLKLQGNGHFEIYKEHQKIAE